MPKTRIRSASWESRTGIFRQEETTRSEGKLGKLKGYHYIVPAFRFPIPKSAESGGEKVGHGSGGMSLLRAA
jgi:hypothetical protein